MDEKIKFILAEEKRKNRIKSRKNTLKKTESKQLTRYDSTIFYMQNTKILGLKELYSIKNLKLDAPNNELSPIKNIKKYFLKPKYSININKINSESKNNQTDHLDSLFKKINPKKILLTNKFLKLLNFEFKNEIKEPNKSNIKSFYNPFKKHHKSISINCIDKNSQTIKPKILKLQKKGNSKILELNDNSLNMDKMPFNTLKHFQKQLFNKNRFQNIIKRHIKRNEDFNKINSNPNFSESFSTCQQSDNNKSTKYEIIELENKKNFFTNKLYENNDINNIILNDLNTSEKNDFHYIMKHPFSVDSFCNSYMNQSIHNNNSYIKDYTGRFKKLDNPLKDKDLIRKLHNLILNPNTNKIRNGKLLSMYKNYPRGSFYGDLSKRYEIIKVDNELKKLEKTKYKKYVVKLKDILKKAKNIQKHLREQLIINKNKF